MWTITSTCSFNTCAIAEEDALAAVLPTLAPIVESSTTLLVTFEEGPDLTTVDGRSTVGVDSAPIDEFTLVAATLPGSDAVCSTMIEGLAEATPPVERQSNSLLNEEQSASLHAGIQALEVEVEMLKKRSISDVELTRTSGFLTQLKDKPGISIMDDHGFTINEMLQAIEVELNIPPFMEGRQQLSADEVQQGWSIESCRIHVERAIGRIKSFNILKNTLPISMARLANQISFDVTGIDSSSISGKVEFGVYCS
ncbi:hypothetical protein EMCRGX_G001100 [Ephydatia muelleri]